MDLKLSIQGPWGISVLQGPSALGAIDPASGRLTSGSDEFKWQSPQITEPTDPFETTGDLPPDLLATLRDIIGPDHVAETFKGTDIPTVKPNPPSPHQPNSQKPK